VDIQTLKEMEKLEKFRFLHRRRTAYISLFAAVSLTFLVALAVLFHDQAAERFHAVEMFLSTALLAFISLVGGYMGISTWKEVKQGPPPAPKAEG